ncbi:DsrE family protein [Georgenia thermotolerans]|nr:DsrE family protein [Georgenia thermotolerans]
MTDGVVIHLDEPGEDKHRAVLRNALNLLPEVPPGTTVEVVVHGPAIDLARPGMPTSHALAQALAAGVTLRVCRNSMRSQGLTDTDLVDGAVPVTSGVGHLVARQRAGWAYLRP